MSKEETMPNKSLQDYISKIKKKPFNHFHLPTKSLSLSTKRFIKSCKHPKTISFSLDRNENDQRQNKSPNDEAATLADIDRFMLENFKSLYIKDEEYDNDEVKNNINQQDSPRFIEPPPHLCGSPRFFTNTDSASSFLEDAGKSATSSDDVASSSCTSSPTTGSKQVMGPEDFITLLTYSPSPYDDFKQSMQEMVEARFHYHGKVDWEFMEELLSCYMDLNDKRSYKYILSAFVDLVVTLREKSSKAREGSRWSAGNFRK